MILPDWYWNWRGRYLVSDFDKDRVNPTGYDMLLGSELMLQVHQGIEYRDRRVWNHDDALVCTETGEELSNVFHPGDSVLASTYEQVWVPRFVKLQGHLKSSLAREGLNHRTALLIDPGFCGHITLELEFATTGVLQRCLPIIQVEASLVFPKKHYGELDKSHYKGQYGVVANRNPHIAFQRVDGQE